MKVRFIAAALLFPAGLAHGGSHAEAPMVTIERANTADITGVYSFTPERNARAAGSISLGTGTTAGGVQQTVESRSGSGVSAAFSTSSVGN